MCPSSPTLQSGMTAGLIFCQLRQVDLVIRARKVSSFGREQSGVRQATI
jgi:hypothetical protein